MTTTASPTPGQPRGTTHRVLLRAALSCVTVLVVLAAVAAATGGGSAAAGLAVGGGLTLVFLLFGGLTVAAATSVSPQVSLLVAMTTFLFVVVLAGGVFYVLDASGAVGSELSRPWLAAGIFVTALTWTVALVVGHARSRVPAFDLRPDGRGDLPATPSERSRRATEVGAG